MLNTPKYRYPGPKPFSPQDKDLFFGREQEKRFLIDLISTNRLTILFGRSGYGKSSIIHAGVIPFFTEENYKVVELRFQPPNLSLSGVKSIREQFINEINKASDAELLFLGNVNINDPQISLWQYFKTLQWYSKKRRL